MTATGTRPHRGAWVLALGMGLASLTACSEAGKTAEDLDTGVAVPGGTDTGSDGDEADTGTVPEWWRIDGSFEVVAGDAVGTTAELTLRVVDEDGAERCVDTVVPTSWSDEEPLPYETVYTWWRVGLPEDGWTCFEAGEGPRRGDLRLGIGAMHPEVQALLGRLDDAEEGADTALNGAYAGLPDDERLLVFGVAGPVAAWAGEGEPASSAILEDGTWQLRAVYAFSL